MIISFVMHFTFGTNLEVPRGKNDNIKGRKKQLALQQRFKKS